MSAIRRGRCAEPGPYDQHCTEYVGHRYSCYDAGEDASWNDRSPEDWQTDTPHECDDPACRELTPEQRLLIAIFGDPDEPEIANEGSTP